ncbi:MAG TPA: MtrB/PioB family decaheme-associated outer membrane protein [Pseudolabrys sp.]|nr:MtrB/PioB family decaheme-associated outer membrane protein [Pseudolabrys sp.]
MKRQAGLVHKCLLGVLLGSVAWAVPGMQALAADQLPVKAPAAVEPIPYWWWHGEVEVGGRFFLNDPQRNGNAFLGQQSLAKFYEYRDLRPGAFGNFWVSTGSRDGLYQVDVGGKNVGYEDQYYYLEASKAGQHYFNFEWDQTPHVLSTSALTFYGGLGTGILTRPSWTLPVPGAPPSGIAPFLYQTDLGFRRDTALATYRWTPTDPWDIRADYSHTSRSGTQVEGIVGFGTAGGPNSTAVQAPRPVDDTTQNYGVNGEYSGTSPWGKKLTVKLAYNGSTYTDNLSNYLAQNPYPTNPGFSPFARMSLWPSNQMNAIGGTMASELPWNSRYAGTLNYTMMRQNEAFQPMSFLNPSFPLPALSLNGQVNTLLSNNVITTQITPELTNKAVYRYYNYDNQTPQLLFPTWISLDRPAANETAIQALVLSYTKQNIGDELVWRPTREWTVGGAYGFERYDWTNFIASATNENSVKLFADWKPASWFTLRSSGYYANRTADNYNLAAFTNNQFPAGGGPGIPGSVNSFKFNPAYRMLMVDDRERWKANVFMDIVVVPGLTITPNFKYQDDHYGLNPAIQMGLTDARSWDAGIDAIYIINPSTSVMVGYTRDFLTQTLYGNTSTSCCTGTAGVTAPVGGAFLTQTNDRIVIDTFVALLRYNVIPDKFDTEFRYTASHGVDTQNLLVGNIAGGVPANGQFPDVTSWWQRFDAVATYTFDRSLVAALGWKGEVKAKLHYAWERSSVANWAQDPLMPFGNTGNPNLIYMAYDNPNYNVHLLSASLAFKW